MIETEERASVGVMARLSPDVYKRLRLLAAEKQISIAEVIRRGIEAVLTAAAREE